MLTADLIRAARRKGKVRARYILKPGDELLSTAAELTKIFERATEASPKWRRGQIDDAVSLLVQHRSEPLLFKGLRKLLFDRTEFEQTTEFDPIALRRRLFEVTAQSGPLREHGRSWEDKRQLLLTAVASELDLSVDQLQASLYADLPANQRILRFRPLAKPDQDRAEVLLDRYNLSLAQSVLLRATQLTIELAPGTVGAYRQLFRSLKFHRLIHAVTDLRGGGYRIQIDGPLSLFSSASRYGLAMAKFLPSLVLLDSPWSLRADILWGKSRDVCVFELDQKTGLRSHLREKGRYVTDEQKRLEDRIRQKFADWKVSRRVSILQTTNGRVVVPDFKLKHETSGKSVAVAIVGYWRKGSLQGLAEALDDRKLSRLILCVSRRLAGEKAPEFLTHPRVVWFKQVISAPSVIAAATGA